MYFGNRSLALAAPREVIIPSRDRKGAVLRDTSPNFGNDAFS
jgi:hypothetical protein